MKHMKTIFALLTSAVMVFSLCACGNSAANDSTSTDTTTEPAETALYSEEASTDTEPGTPSDAPRYAS